MAEPWRLQRRDLCIPLGGGARGKLQGWLSRIVDRGLAQKTRAVDRITEPLSSKNKMADRRVLEIMPSGAELEVRIRLAPAESPSNLAGNVTDGKRGWSLNQDTPQHAAEVALGACGAAGCKVIVSTGPAMCSALAATENGKYIGAASRADRIDARLAALANCQKGNAGECSIQLTTCNQ